MVKSLTEQVKPAPVPNTPVPNIPPQVPSNRRESRSSDTDSCQDYSGSATLPGVMASILLVDDDFDGTEALAHTLRRSGHEVRHVANGRDALSAILERLPQLVIL